MGYYQCSSSHGDKYAVLQQCLKDILSFIKPSSNEKAMRDRALLELETVVQSMEFLKGPTGYVVRVRPFGSFLSVLDTKWGDLDISVELGNHSFTCIDRQRNIEMLQNINNELWPLWRKDMLTYIDRQRKIAVLYNIKNELWRKDVARNFNFIPSARVPVLRYESKRQNISCDVSIDNYLGWMKSRVLFLISGIDERFRELVLLVKEWAMAHGINDPKSGTLNSYSLCLLVIFHFQTCEPAILPPLKDIYGRNFDDLSGSIEREIEDACIANIAKFKSSRQRNRDNLAELFIDFFDKFCSIGRLSSDFGICTYTGQCERIRSNSRWMEKSHSLLIEDPFDRPDNAARTVCSQELGMISEAFNKTSRKLSKSSVVSNRTALLAKIVRPKIHAELEDTVVFVGTI